MKRLLFISILFFCVTCTKHEQNNPFDQSGNDWNPPVVTAQADTSINIKDSIVLTATATDNGTVVSYFWSFDGVNFTDTTVTGAIKTAFNTSGTDTVLVKVIDDDGVESQADDIIVTVTLDAPLVTSQKDTVVSQTMNCLVNVIAVDANNSGSIEKYYWDINADGWDDSSDTPTYTFSKPEGGGMDVIWGARDDDGIISTDTFAILFNRPPSSASLSAPTSESDWVDFDYNTYIGSLRLSFKAVDPEGNYDTLTYTLWLSSDSSGWTEKYSGRDTLYMAASLDTVTKYFWKLRVVDLYGDSLINAGSFITPPNTKIGDIDGNVYHTVKIGNQVWTVENLRTTRYNDGAAIPYVTENTAWINLFTPGYCYYGNDSAANAVKYGALYNWHTVNTGKLAPAGWHVPKDAEWDTLQNYLIANGYNWNGTTTGNKIAKAMAAKTDWNSSGIEGAVGNDVQSNNSSVFSALPGGFRNNNGYFNNQGFYGNLWSSSEAGASYAFYRNLYFDGGGLGRSDGNKMYGFSVRLLRD